MSDVSETAQEQAVKSEPEKTTEQPAAPQRQPIQVDDTKAVACYANFCRVTGTPEELILDYGLNPQPIGTPTSPIPVSQRIITNYYTAKRMLYALQMSIQRHEQVFGVLEIDVQRRVQPSAQRGTPPAAEQK